jgi:SAM-dependent methyltransferase
MAIDVGCGVGSNLDLLKSMGFRVIGIDSEIYSLSFAKRCFTEVPFVNGNLINLPFKSTSVDLIIASDILEHLEEEIIGIKEIHRTLKRDGKAIFTVPAFKFLWGVQDVVGMHKRRYSRRELILKIEHEGFKILRSSYFNFFLFLPIFLARRIINILGLRINSENKINSPFTNFCFKVIFSLEPYLLKYLSFPFGVSIFCIARKS